MPNRIIRDGLLTSEKFDALNWRDQCFFMRVLLVVDDYGRYDARAKVLRSILFPLSLEKVSQSDVESCLKSLEAAGLVRLYSVAGKPYLEVLNFRQRVRAKLSKYPSPDGEENDSRLTDTCQTDDRQMTDTCQSYDGHVRAKTKTNSEANSEAEAKHENTVQSNSLPPLAAAALSRATAGAPARSGCQALPRSAEEVRDYLRKEPLIGLRGKELEECAHDFFDRYESVGWVQNGGTPITNWRARARLHATKWRNHLSDVKPTGGSNSPRRASKPRMSNAVEFKEGEYTDL